MKIINIDSKNNSSFGMRFTPETKKLAEDTGIAAMNYLKNSETLESSSNYLVHIIPPKVKTTFQKLFGPKDNNSNYWHLCVSNPKEFPELGDTFYPFLSFTKENSLTDVVKVFVSDFFVKEHAYNALAKASKVVANVEHQPYPRPSFKIISSNF